MTGNPKNINQIKYVYVPVGRKDYAMSRKQKVQMHPRGYDKKGKTLSICMNVSKTENSVNQLKVLTEVEAKTHKMT